MVIAMHTPKPPALAAIAFLLLLPDAALAQARSSAGSEVRLSRSEVIFRPLLAEEIRAYWDSGEPQDKAGGYAIQGLAAVFVSALAGSFSGVMGLPLFEAAELLRPWLSNWPEKLLYGSDATPNTDETSWEETGWISSQSARQALATALADMVRDGEATGARASQIGRGVLRQNAVRLYGF